MEQKDLQVRDKMEVEPAGELTQEGSFFLPNVDILEDKNELVLIADMPGVAKEDVDIRLEENQLRIQGKVSAKTPGEYVLSEYSVGDYYRTFSLSNVIDQSKINASMKNGVLRVTLPKSDISKPRKITVNA